MVVALGPSCFQTCGTFLEQGLNLCLLHWQADSLSLNHQGSPPGHSFASGPLEAEKEDGFT